MVLLPFSGPPFSLRGDYLDFLVQQMSGINSVGPLDIRFDINKQRSTFLSITKAEKHQG
jgi:hypothetical protein